jgi:hypothetical protein
MNRLIATMAAASCLVIAAASAPLDLALAKGASHAASGHGAHAGSHARGRHARHAALAGRTGSFTSNGSSMAIGDNGAVDAFCTTSSSWSLFPWMPANSSDRVSTPDC